MMKLERETWYLIAATVVICGLVNFLCWDPGMGGATGGRPPGFELELYFGWPAQYRAEHWRSNDIDRLLRPKGLFPFASRHQTMTLLSRYVGWTATAINVAFWLGAIVLVAIVGELDTSARLSKPRLLLALPIAAVMYVLYSYADRVTVHL